jgi:hypothetical protein
VQAAERVIKERKVPRSALVNIVRSINPNLMPSTGMTTRKILQKFFTEATSSQAEKLLDVLAATGGSDPFLRGISETRR